MPEFFTLTERSFKAAIGDFGVKGHGEGTHLEIKFALDVVDVHDARLTGWLTQAKRSGLECEITVRVPKDPQLHLFESLDQGVDATTFAAMESYAEAKRNARHEPTDLPDMPDLGTEEAEPVEDTEPVEEAEPEVEAAAEPEVEAVAEPEQAEKRSRRRAETVAVEA